MLKKRLKIFISQEIIHQIPIRFAIVLLMIFPALMLKEVTRQTKTFGGVEFPHGAVSFADQVVAYSPESCLFSPSASKKTDKPQKVLGIPDSSVIFAQDERVFLGCGGILTLKFSNNLLTGSDDPKPDLWVFLEGKAPTSVAVEISQDGIQWHSLGKLSPTQPGIDIDALGWSSRDFFTYIRLNNSKNAVHIDAVGAVSTAILTSDQ